MSSCKAFSAPLSRMQLPQTGSACLGPRVWHSGFSMGCTAQNTVRNERVNATPSSQLARVDPVSELSWEEELCSGLSLELSFVQVFQLPRGTAAPAGHSPSPVPNAPLQRGCTRGCNRRKPKPFPLVNCPGGLSSPEQHSERLRRQPRAAPCAWGDSREAAWITKFQGTEGWGKQCFKWTCLKLPHGRWTLATHVSRIVRKACYVFK